ncbi:hypothetical protein Pdw03_1461 [Penicillium digitatum]|uniref:Uncharacterized protein n=1 Tax=Penicillium digitatum TaxID=36651 RepID=A0A7T6XSE9_PENDI|nr:hypothetical protein Pdw03_1461 [Penicillium digitatum]
MPDSFHPSYRDKHCLPKATTRSYKRSSTFIFLFLTSIPRSHASDFVARSLMILTLLHLPKSTLSPGRHSIVLFINQSDQDYNITKEDSPSKPDGTPANSKTPARHHKSTPERTSRATTWRARINHLFPTDFPTIGSAVLVPHHHRSVPRPRQHSLQITLPMTNFTQHHSPHSSSRTQMSPIGTLAGSSRILANTPVARGHVGQSGVGPGSWETLCIFILLSVLNRYRIRAWRVRAPLRSRFQML